MPLAAYSNASECKTSRIQLPHTVRERESCFTWPQLDLELAHLLCQLLLHVPPPSLPASMPPLKWMPMLAYLQSNRRVTSPALPLPLPLQLDTQLNQIIITSTSPSLPFSHIVVAPHWTPFVPFPNCHFTFCWPVVPCPFCHEISAIGSRCYATLGSLSPSLPLTLPLPLSFFYRLTL